MAIQSFRFAFDVLGFIRFCLGFFSFRACLILFLPFFFLRKKNLLYYCILFFYFTICFSWCAIARPKASLSAVPQHRPFVSTTTTTTADFLGCYLLRLLRRFRNPPTLGNRRSSLRLGTAVDLPGPGGNASFPAFPSWLLRTCAFCPVRAIHFLSSSPLSSRLSSFPSPFLHGTAYLYYSIAPQFIPISLQSTVRTAPALLDSICCSLQF